jgi:uncharacterized membrane protein
LQSVSFVLLLFVTIFAVFLAIVYNRIEIAIIAILGGFVSPLMVSNGSGNYIVLFSYLMILNSGMLVLSYYKKWRPINFITFVLTILFFATWLGNELIENDYSTFKGAIFFASGFYIIFFLMNILYNIKNGIKFKVLEISLLLSNTFIYFSFMMLMLRHINNGVYKGLFAVILAVFNFVFAFYINKRQNSDKQLLYLLVGLVFTFITLSIPLQLEGNYITLFWATESVLLLWLSQKSGFRIMKIGSSLVLGLMIISLIMDWGQSYETNLVDVNGQVKRYAFLINKMFITSTASGISLLVSLFLLKKEKVQNVSLLTIDNYKAIVLGLAILVIYIGTSLEISYQSLYYFPLKTSQQIILLTYNIFVFNILLFLTYKIKNRNYSAFISGLTVLFILIMFTALSKVYYHNLYSYIDPNQWLSSSLLFFRWLSIIGMYILVFNLFKVINRVNSTKSIQVYRFNLSLFILTLLLLLSVDLDAFALLLSNDKEILLHTQKAGYTVLWGVSSFILMVLGMRKKVKFMRIISLFLFAITIIKLFFYDISNISEGGKIIAFIILGVLLLIISFMYQRVKRLVIDDQVKKENSNPTQEK